MGRMLLRVYFLVLASLYLPWVEVAGRAHLSTGTRFIFGVAFGIGLLQAWVGLRLDSILKQSRSIPGELIFITAGYSTFWNLVLHKGNDLNLAHWEDCLKYAGIAACILMFSHSRQEPVAVKPEKVCA